MTKDQHRIPKILVKEKGKRKNSYKEKATRKRAERKKESN
jgi:hypothetical protein